MASASTMPTVPFDAYTPRVAIVTGASRGIGRAIVLRLADDGIDVAVNDIAAQQDGIDKVVEEVRRKGRRAIAVTGDVSVEEDVTTMVEKTAKELGSVDMMIANAGIYPTSAFIETSVETFRKVMDINILGVFLCFKYAAIQMIEQGRGGRLIAASSAAGKKGSPGFASYSASKFAVRGLVQSASLELRTYGITVNGYAPGFIAHPSLLLTLEEDVLKRLESRSSTGKPEDIASMVSYLVKPEAYFVNGQTVNVNGGSNIFD
ncbi:NAD-binding protein [Sanghuangporus baumii]|uniref:3-oxoacyl-[acyl-carrier-protein] reductase n=1 Tax=Sanghuangporus baumii TaxID=108892 RepID=A0A9Q5I0F3_SANBA|nr:NAD-binding protein [Sanghuangporus baumii]